MADEITPNIEVFVMWLGWYYLENGEPERALDYYRRHVRDYPENCNYAYRLAAVQERVDDFEGALESLENVARRCPEHRDAITAAAAICVKLERYDRAGEDPQKVARRPSE